MSVRPSGLRGALSLPAVGLTLMPKVVCPACWPAYAGLLSAVGVGFIPTAAYLVPLTVVFLAVAVAPLAMRARSGKSRVPFVLGLVASASSFSGSLGCARTPRRMSVWPSSSRHGSASRGHTGRLQPIPPVLHALQARA